ncbi:hypothetical protein D3C85_1481670 [compost metagenome]
MCTLTITGRSAKAKFFNRRGKISCSKYSGAQMLKVAGCTDGSNAGAPAWHRLMLSRIFSTWGYMLPALYVGRMPVRVLMNSSSSKLLRSFFRQ